MQKYSLKQIVGSDKSQLEQGLTPSIEVLPARMTAEQAARFLGFSPEAIPVLIESKLLEPLGEPVPNAQKFFAKVYIVELANKVQWLNDATQAVYDYWRKKNERKTINLTPVAQAA